MKLSSLPATHADSRGTRRGQAVQGTGGSLWHIDATEACNPDSQQSLQQQISTIEQAAIGDFKGRDQVLSDARALAANISAMGDGATHLVRPDCLRIQRPSVDEEV